MTTVWPLPKLTFAAIAAIEETRPVALLTSEATWTAIGHQLYLPLVVQAEPTSTERDLLNHLTDNLPSQVEVVYVVGTGIPVTAGKLVASKNKLPLVIVPTAIESDEIFEAHVTLPAEGLIHQVETGPAHEVILDWDLIQSAPSHLRAAGIVDVLAIVTALLDWRHAAKLNRNTPQQKFSAWGAGIAAALASQVIKSAKAIGEGDAEALRTLVDLMMMSVQLAGQLGHDRHQEGTEHYLAYALENRGVKVSHAEAVGPGILFASALHGQDPSALREALEAAGVRLDRVRSGDVRLAINDLPAFCVTNNLPYSIAHELDPLSEQVTQALQKAGIELPVWQPAEAPAAATQEPVPVAIPPIAPAVTLEPAPSAPPADDLPPISTQTVVDSDDLPPATFDTTSG